MGWVTKKKNAVVFSHNGLGNKINWLTVNRQS
jgi:hypothetical protein